MALLHLGFKVRDELGTVGLWVKGTLAEVTEDGVDVECAGMLIIGGELSTKAARVAVASAVA